MASFSPVGDTPLARYIVATQPAFCELFDLAYGRSNDGWTANVIRPWALNLIRIDDLVTEMLVVLAQRDYQRDVAPLVDRLAQHTEGVS
jgi:hypothetical protein